MVIKNDAYLDLDGNPISQGDTNLILNGDFLSWQEGTSFTSIPGTTYFADMFRYKKTGAMVHDISRSTDVPTVGESGHLSQYSMLVACTTIDGSLAAGDIATIEQVIEGYKFLQIAQRTFTISFWHKHSKVGTYCVRATNGNLDRSFVAEYSQTTTNVWEKAEITVTASPSAGTWNYANSTGIYFSFTLAAGDTFDDGVNETWVTGNQVATANQVNACDNTANTFRLAQIKIEPGAEATRFVGRGLAEEMDLINRYFIRTYNSGVASGASAEYQGACYFAWTASTAQKGGWFRFPTRMRANPTLTVYAPSDGTAAELDSGGASVAAVTHDIGESGCGVYTNDAVSSATIRFHLVADARL